MQANHNCCETIESEQAEKDRDYFVPLIRRICGNQTTSQIFERVFRKEKMLYDWLRENPSAGKNEIRRKSHEIAGTLCGQELLPYTVAYFSPPLWEKAGVPEAESNDIVGGRGQNDDRSGNDRRRFWEE